MDGGLQQEADITQPRRLYTSGAWVTDAATDAFVGMDRDGRITDWNQQAEATFGWPHDEVIGRGLVDTIIPRQHREAHEAGLARFLATGEANIINQHIEITAIDRHGREFPVELAVRALDEGTDAVRFHAFVRDISERRAHQDALRDSEVKHHLLADQLAAAQQTAGIGSWEWDVAADTVSWSDELYRMFGLEPGQHPSTVEDYLARVHPDDRALAASTIQTALENREDFAFDHRLVRSDRAVVWVHGRGQLEVGADGVPVRISGTAADITERVVHQQELAALALIDDLTGLHNRRSFVSLADHQLKVAARAGRPVPLLFIDMNGLKTINDTYGHNEGDRALVEVAKFLRTTLRSSDLIARLGGDEFCILMVEDRGGSRIILDRVLAELRAGPSRGKRPYALSLSVGVAWLEPGSGTSVEDLMGQADCAMYEDKASQREVARALVGDTGDARDQAGDQRDHAGDARDHAGDARDHAGDARDHAGDARDQAGDQRDHAGDARDHAGDARDHAAEQDEGEIGREITADVLRNSALARLEAATDRTRASQDRRAAAGERTEAERDRGAASADRRAAAGERTEAEQDRGAASADREARG